MMPSVYKKRECTVVSLTRSVFLMLLRFGCWMRLLECVQQVVA